MYAILKTGVKQYKVKVGDLVDIERIEGEIGSKLTFSEILGIGEENGKLQVGAPLIANASVEAEIADQFRGKKLIAFKKKRRKGYSRKVGHRQEITRVKIAAITAG